MIIISLPVPETNEQFGSSDDELYTDESDSSSENQTNREFNENNQQNYYEMRRKTHMNKIKRHPLNSNYRMEYAAFELKNKNLNNVEYIIQEALVSLPMSIDLWIYYTTYLRHYKSSDVDRIRKAFENAVRMCGLDYNSDQLWIDYIEWEYQKQEYVKAYFIFNHLLTVPTKGCLHNFNKFHNFIYNNSIESLFSAPIIINNRSLTMNALLRNVYLSIPENANIVSSELEDILSALLKVAIVKSGFYVHLKTNRKSFNRLEYEESIKLSGIDTPTLIENWKAYLNFEKYNGEQERIIYLYEKCLHTPSCAKHEEFWLDYLNYLKSLNVSQAHILMGNLLERACLVYHPTSLVLNLEYAIYEKNKKNYQLAEMILVRLEYSHPNSREIAEIRTDLIILSSECDN